MSIPGTRDFHHGLLGSRVLDEGADEVRLCVMLSAQAEA